MEQIELDVNAHAYLGSAIGRDESGRVIFVPYSIPGEKVRVEISDVHKRWARARILETVSASQDRVAPRCKHFMECGGCHYQHMSYALQLEAKQEIVRSQLERIGGLDQPPVLVAVPSPSPWHTRNHMQFSVTQEGQIGLHAAQSETVIAIEECYLANEKINTLWPNLDLGSIPGLERVTIRSGVDDEMMIIFHSEFDPEVDLKIDLTASVVWMGAKRTVVMAGDDHIAMRAHDRDFRVSAGSFFQVHSTLVSQLVDRAMQALDINQDELILDLYAGVGLFSAHIAERAAQLIAVEQSPWAAADFEVNLAEFDNVILYEAHVEDVLPTIEMKPHAVLVDPPRTGLGKNVVQKLTELEPSRIIYISCDPTTLARDAKKLADGGYRLEAVIPYDLFPQTFHIETLSIWRR